MSCSFREVIEARTSFFFFALLLSASSSLFELCLRRILQSSMHYHQNHAHQAQWMHTHTHTHGPTVITIQHSSEMERHCHLPTSSVFVIPRLLAFFIFFLSFFFTILPRLFNLTTVSSELKHQGLDNVCYSLATASHFSPFDKFL